MSSVAAEPRKGFKLRLGSALRSSKPRTTLRKGSIPSSTSEATSLVSLPPSVSAREPETAQIPAAPSIRPDAALQESRPLAPLEAHREKYREKWEGIDSERGERRDYTELIHALGRFEPFDSEESSQAEEPDLRPSGERMIASLSPELWDIVATFLEPVEVANLALSNRTLYTRLGSRPWERLDQPENWSRKIEFLIRFDHQLPGHLLCFPCAKYHLRTQIGNENLRPSHILNPLFKCPNAQNAVRPAPRTRISPGRNLPFAFVQLALRRHNFTPLHGIEIGNICKRWRRDGWSYRTTYHIHNNHLLMRVVASCFASADLSAAGMRLLLFSRDDYSPYFSVCSHWKEGDLMHVCKCALTHIPTPPQTGGPQRAGAAFREELAGRPHGAMSIVTLCGNCRPLRRCPKCPTEYLVEAKLTEDTSIRGRLAFRYAIIVTRWSDLGDGTSPLSPEWAACNGEGAPYDSFAALQKRAISAIFESALARDAIPHHRIVSLHPKINGLRGAGESWY